VRRRRFIQTAGAAVAAGAVGEAGPTLRIGLTADPHLLGRRTPRHEAFLKAFVEAMALWKPDVVVDLGDFACQAGTGQTTRELHDKQLAGLVRHWAAYRRVPCPAYLVMGNHDVGWLRGGDESITPEDLTKRPHAGEDITKHEWLRVTKLPGRYYSFDVKGTHFIVLDGNNARHKGAPEPGHDGVAGAYFVDPAQMAWLARDLAAHRDKLKLVFSHEELHHTPAEGSGEGGDTPFPNIGKAISYIDNGWELRKLFADDGKVLACFAGHKHRNRWTVYGGTHYITLAATHRGGSYAKVTISDALRIEGHANQKSYTLPLLARGAR